MSRTTIRHAPTSGHVSITSTRTPITSYPTYLVRGVLVRASIDNTEVVYLGGANVTADDAETSGGMYLYAGDGLFLEAEDMNRIYAVAATGLQDLAWLSL